MRASIVASITALATTAFADFFLANSSICFGAFPLEHCTIGPNVLTGISNETDFVCPKLMHAEDNAYMWNGTAGPFGSPNLYSNNPCNNAGNLHFIKDGNGYFAEDASGSTIADCIEDNSFNKSCSVWIGAYFFEVAYKCTSRLTCTTK
jgi:hypothetical protein